MWSQTAQLPEVEIKSPGTILTKNTSSNMQAGLFYGFLGQTEYIIRQFKKELGRKDIKSSRPAAWARSSIGILT